MLYSKCSKQTLVLRLRACSHSYLIELFWGLVIIDSREITAKSDWRIDEALGFKTSKVCVEPQERFSQFFKILTSLLCRSMLKMDRALFMATMTLETMMVRIYDISTLWLSLEAVNIQPCNIKVKLLRKMNSGVGSEWLIDNNALEILDNDPQQLIQCTSPGDKVVFHLASVRKFKHPLVVSHELEMIARSPETNNVEDEWGSNASFTCPDSGPFLTVKYDVCKLPLGFVNKIVFVVALVSKLVVSL